MPTDSLAPSRTSRASRARQAMLALAFFGAVTPLAQAQWTCTSLHPMGAIHSSAYGTSSAQQVGYVQVGPTVGHFRAAIWNGSSASWTNLHPTSSGYSIAYATDGAQQVGEYDPAGFPRAALWSGNAGSWVDLHPASGPSQSAALGVGGGEQVGWTNDGAYSAARWTGSAATWTNLNPPPTAGYVHVSEAYATDAGRQVGYFVNVGGVISAALWSGSAASLVNLHPAGVISSWAYGIGDGQQVGVVRVTSGGGASHASLWTGSAASWVDLHPSGPLNSRASSAAGGMQVGHTVTEGISHAALWRGTAATWVDLHAFVPPGFSSSQARGISISGSSTLVVGSGFNNFTGREEALLWTGPLPCVAPVVTGDPLDATECPSSNVTFTVTASGSTPIAYHWRKDTIPINTVSNPSAATDTLTLLNVQTPDSGMYDCVLTNACGNDTCNPARLLVCAADVNCDGIVDILDFLDFIDAFGACEGMPLPCSGSTGLGADYNGDTLVDILDFLDFINDFGGGCV